MNLIVADDLHVVNFSYVWKIFNFCGRSKMNFNLLSPFFKMDNLVWQLQFCPENIILGISGNTGYHSVFLKSLNNVIVVASAKLSILDDKNEKFKTMATLSNNNQFKPHISIGWTKFIAADLLLNPNSKLLTNDTVTILCEIVIDNIVYNSLKASETLLKTQKNFSEFLENDNLSDVSLVIGNEKIPAHKVLLANKSPVFKAMFNHEMVENQRSEVVINNIEYVILKEMLHFVYDESTFQILSEEHAEKLLIVGDMYEILELVWKCERYLSHKLTLNNVIRFLNLGFTYNALNLKTKALHFISVHAKKFSFNQFKEVGNLHADLIAEVMSIIVLGN